MRTLPEDTATKLFELLETKGYEELGQEERTFVLQWLSQTEYEAFYLAPKTFVLSLNQEYKKLSPSRNVRKSILEEARLAKARKTISTPWWQWRWAPVYQLTIGLALVLAIIWIWHRTPVPSPQEKLITQCDTLYQVVEKVREVIKRDTIVKVVVAKESPTEGPKTLPREQTEPMNQSFEKLSLGYASSPDFDSSHTSSSTLTEDSGFVRFSVKAF